MGRTKIKTATVRRGLAREARTDSHPLLSDPPDESYEQSDEDDGEDDSLDDDGLPSEEDEDEADEDHTEEPA